MSHEDRQYMRQSTDRIYRQAVREYRRERVTLVARELRAESEEEIRAAVRMVTECEVKP